MTVSLLHSVAADGSFSAAGAAAWDAQHVLTQATDRLLGRTTAGVGATEEITVGAGLTLSGGTLVNAGATSPIGGSNTQVQFNDGGVFAGNANFTFNKATNQIAIAAGTAAAPTLIPTGDTNTGVWFPAADTIAASTGGTERFRILSSGNVGIGTSSPDALLSVNGIASFGAGAVGTPSIAAFGDLDTGMWFPAANTIAWSTAGAERLRIASSGLVSTTGNLSVAGGGTLSATQITWTSSASFQPQIFLTNSAANATGAIWTTVKSRGGTTPANSGDTIGNFVFASYTSTATTWNAAQIDAVSAGVTATRHAGSLRFTITDTSDVYSERMRINSDGRVGIGTSFPGAILQVNSEIRVADGTTTLRSITSGGVSFFGNITNHPIAIQTNNVERVRISADGNVGIGTSTFGTSAVSSFAIATGTAPTTGPADTIQIYSTDLSAGNTMLSLYTEGTVVNANVVAATTHRIAIRVNGTIYYLLANTAP